MSLVIRPMHFDDVATVDEIWRSVFHPPGTTVDEPVEPRTAEAELADRSRFLHLLNTDPAGAAVAEIDGVTVGLCQSLRRGDQFVLSRLGVAPDFQGQGIGRKLLAFALSYGEETIEQYIWSSQDPRALHSYVREGFTLRPTVTLTGNARGGSVERHVIQMDEKGIEFADAIDLAVRGVSRRQDLQFWFASGANLVVDEEGGYLIFNKTRLTTLAATSIPVAKRLLTGALQGYGDLPPLEAGWVVAEQQWAIEAAASCGATISNYGAMMTRNVVELAVPYLPNALLG